MQTKHLALIAGAIGLLASVVLVMALRSGPESTDVLTPSLTPLTRLSPRDVDRITIRADGDEVAIVRGEARWTVGQRSAFAFKLDALWDLLRGLDGAPTVVTNPQNHAALGVTPDQALSVTFWSNGEVVGELLVGNWSPDAKATFIRHPPDDAVAVVAADLRTFLEPTVESWRDRIIVDANNIIAGSLRFSFPDEEFTVRLVAKPSDDSAAAAEERARQAAVNYEGLTLTGTPGPAYSGGTEPQPTPTPEMTWVIQTEDGEELPTSSEAMSSLLLSLAPLLATGFADDQWDTLAETKPAWSLDVRPIMFGAPARLDFYPRDEDSYYVRKRDTREVFLLDAVTARGLMKRAEDLQGLLPLERAP